MAHRQRQHEHERATGTLPAAGPWDAPDAALGGVVAITTTQSTARAIMPMATPLSTSTLAASV
ncbi:MAG: hypothetical protein R2742_11125 [Micropruina glycogenica]